MKWNQVKEQWPSVEAEVRRTWGRIDETDLAMIQGDRDSFARILAQRYGYEQADAQQKLDVFIDRLDPDNKRRFKPSWFSQQLRKCWSHLHVSRNV